MTGVHPPHPATFSSFKFRFSVNSFLGIRPGLIANIICLTRARGSGGWRNRIQTKYPKMVQGKQWHTCMINFKATTKKTLSKKKLLSDNYIQNRGNPTGEQNYMAFDLILAVWNLQTKEKERKECQKFRTGKGSKRGRPQLKGGREVNGMKPKRTCLGQTPPEVAWGMPRRAFFYLFQLRCRSVCHFFKEVSRDQRSREFKGKRDKR